MYDILSQRTSQALCLGVHRRHLDNTLKRVDQSRERAIVLASIIGSQQQVVDGGREEEIEIRRVHLQLEKVVL